MEKEITQTITLENDLRINTVEVIKKQEVLSILAGLVKAYAIKKKTERGSNMIKENQALCAATYVKVSTNG